MRLKNILYVSALCGILANVCCAQQLREVDQRFSIPMSELIFKLDTVYNFNLDKYFVKCMVLNEYSGVSNMEGEVVDDVYLLFSDYGEYPEGKVYEINNLYNVHDIRVANNESVNITYGSKLNPKELIFSIPNLRRR